MKKIVLFLILYFLGYFSFSQNEADKSENVYNIIKGIVTIGDAIDYDIKLKQSQKKLDEMRQNNSPDIDCWHIDKDGSLQQNIIENCWVGGVNYGRLLCSSCKEIEYEYELKKQCVDLGLPSGTMWKANNENGYYNYNEAIKKFSKHLPTKKQWEELVNYCYWYWDGRGYKITGKNGQYIYMPADGCRVYQANNEICRVGINGVYSSSTPDGQNASYGLFFGDKKIIKISPMNPYNGLSVRLVIQ